MAMKKYVAVRLEGRHTFLAFENEAKDNPKQPDFQHEGLEVWLLESEESERGE